MANRIIKGNCQVHVNQFKIKRNRLRSEKEPVISVRHKKTGRVTLAHEVKICGDCRVIYSPDEPLPDGAVVWIETPANGVEIIKE